MKRYTSRDQILKDIDRAHAKIKKLEAQAQEQLDAESLYIGTTEIKQRREHGDAADNLLKKVKYQRERRLKKLGEKLAEFDTGVFWCNDQAQRPPREAAPSAEKGNEYE